MPRADLNLQSRWLAARARRCAGFGRVAASRARGCAPLVAALAVALGACQSPDEPLPGELAVDGHELRDTDGNVVFAVEELPDEIVVNGDSAFGAAARITGAAPSPDGRWLSLTSAGAAHGAGWLLRSGTRDPRPAAFQYGGGVRPGPWSPDSAYAVFVHEGPAGGSTLSVASTEGEGDTVADRSRAVRVPDHDARTPEQMRYKPLEWEGDDLHFEVDDRRWIYRARDGDVRRRGGS